MSQSSITLGCSHDPKVVIKKGTWDKIPCEILLCESCRYDPDLVHFEEEIKL